MRTAKIIEGLAEKVAEAYNLLRGRVYIVPVVKKN